MPTVLHRLWTGSGKSTLVRGLMRLIEPGTGLVFWTDTEVATWPAQLCDRVIVMHLGRIVQQGPTATLCGQPQHPCTRALLAAAPGHFLMDSSCAS